MCALEPCICLDPGENAYSPRPPKQTKMLDLSSSSHFAIRAIKYADGYHSEASISMTHQEDKNWPVTSGPRMATDDYVLRRFIPLGYILMRICGRWVKTGHALIIDASYGRKCHPWIVLAAEWDTNDEEYMERHGTDVVKLPKKVKFNDPDPFGILPNSNNRTVIAPLKHCEGTKVGNEKFASHFGLDFSFDLESMGTRIEDHRSEWGPDLADIMSWWWDPEKKEEICYTSDGEPCIRYDPATRKYEGPGAATPDEVGNILDDVPTPAETHQNRGLTMPPGPSGSGSTRQHCQEYGPSHGHGQRQESSAWSPNAW